MWPNDVQWKALADGQRFVLDGRPCALHVVDCGELVIPTGQLLACDPFAMMLPSDNATIALPPGQYPVKVTVADVSEQSDGSHLREAYATLLLSERPEATRRPLTPLRPGETAPELEADEFIGFGVDAGTACFVDAGALAYGMPDESTWHDDLFDSGEDNSWFSRMDDPNHIQYGIANIPLPLARDGANIILIHSGWGDGHYPIVGGFDAAGNLVRVHLDFFVIPAPNTVPAE
jgi:hypothetical protein